MVLIRLPQAAGADLSMITAQAADVLIGKVIVDTEGNPITGTMVNNGAISQALNCGQSYTVPAGYHNGSGTVTANSLASQTGVDSGKNAIVSGAVAETYQGWVDGTKVTGSLKKYATSAQTYYPNTSADVTVAANSYNPYAITFKKLTISNSLTAAGVLSGQAITVNNGSTDLVKVTGSMTNRGAVSQTLAANGSYTIPAGYHNGSGKVTQSLTTQAAKTVTPSTSSQTAVSAGTYCSGAITVGAIPNQTAGGSYNAGTSAKTIVAANKYLTSAVTLGAITQNLTAADIITGKTLAVASGGTNIITLAGTAAKGGVLASGTINGSGTDIPLASISSYLTPSKYAMRIGLQIVLSTPGGAQYQVYTMTAPCGESFQYKVPSNSVTLTMTYANNKISVSSTGSWGSSISFSSVRDMTYTIGQIGS